MPILTASERIGTGVGGRYRIISLLAEGGFSAVFEGEHLVTARPVALKLVHAHLVKTEQVGQRFLREAQAMARIRHPGIVEVLDADREPDGTVWIALELLEGETLEQALRRATRMPVNDAVRYTCGVLDALDMVHTHGIVHRDIKPANIFLAEAHDGTRRAKLLDFGIAHVATQDGGRLTHTGMILGTPEYMAPEQGATQGKLGPQADLWSVGVVLWELLTGDVPWLGDNATVTLFRAAHEPMPDLLALRPDVPAEVLAVIRRALEKEPAARYANAREMRVALAQAMREAGLDPTGRFEPGPRMIRRADSSASMPAMRMSSPGAVVPPSRVSLAPTPSESLASASGPPSVRPAPARAQGLESAGSRRDGSSPRIELELDLGPSAVTSTPAEEARALDLASHGAVASDALPELDSPRGRPSIPPRFSSAGMPAVRPETSPHSVLAQHGPEDDDPGGKVPDLEMALAPMDARNGPRTSPSMPRMPAGGMAMRTGDSAKQEAPAVHVSSRSGQQTTTANVQQASRDVAEMVRTSARAWRIVLLTGAALGAGLVGIYFLREHARNETEARRHADENAQSGNEVHARPAPAIAVRSLATRYTIPVPVGLGEDDVRAFARHVAAAGVTRRGGLRTIATCAHGTVYLYGNGDGLPVASRPAPIACDHEDLAVVSDVDGDGQDDLAAVDASGDGVLVLAGRDLRIERTIALPHAVGVIGGLTVRGAPALVAYSEPDGAAGTTSLAALDARSGQVLWRASGVAPLGRLGHPSELGLAVGPDATGDGVPDVVAGATAAAGTPVDAIPARPRCVELLSGATGDQVWDQPFCQLRGGSQSVALGPDVNGDGAADVVVGSDIVRGADAHVVILSGRNGSVLRRVAVPDGPVAVGFGWPVALGDDLDGDGHPDLAVGSVGSSGTFVSVLSATTGVPMAAWRVPGRLGFPELGVTIADGLTRGAGAALLIAGADDGVHVASLSDEPSTVH